MIQAPRLFARVLPLVRTWHGCNGYAALGRRGLLFHTCVSARIARARAGLDCLRNVRRSRTTWMGGLDA